MILKIKHDMLVTAQDLPSSENRIRSFFEKSQLVHYDSIEIYPSNCINATAPQFEERLEQLVDSNRQVLSRLLAKLNQEGCSNLQDLLTLPQGFQSKLLHTASHLLDGFFGIDSKFYDIDEISHWITDGRKRQIMSSPNTCWLIHVKAQSVYGQGFEKKNSD